MIYTVGKLAGQKKPSAEFLAKEINGESRPLSQVEIHGRPLYILSDYALYKAQIDAFLFATAKQEKVLCNVSGYPFSWSNEHVIRFPFPYVSSRFNIKSFNDATLEELKTDLGMVVNSSSGQMLDVVFTRPHGKKETFEKFLINAKDMNPKFSSFNDKQACSVFGFLSYFASLELVSAFLATNCYPAFKTHEVNPDTDPVLREIIYARDGMTHGLDARKESFGEDGMPMIVDEPEPRSEGAPEHSLGYVVGHVVARPSPLSTRNAGPVGLVPALPGTLFPYFHDMIEPDFTYAGGVLAKLFGRLFGTESEDRDIQTVEFMQGARNWSTTVAGMALSHVVKGIELALETQTLLYVIVEDGSYKGFTLLGGGYEIIAQDKVIGPCTQPVLFQELSTLTSHTAVLNQIATLLSGVDLKTANAEGQTRVEIHGPAIDTPRKLAREVRLRKVTKARLFRVSMNPQYRYPRLG